ncbi:MAG: hypothetical protein KA354_04540 [Phycisphaerae bacterium]|nr:hypothetical protein [Phycisphaerae bacterium]
MELGSTSGGTAPSRSVPRTAIEINCCRSRFGLSWVVAMIRYAVFAGGVPSSSASLLVPTKVEGPVHQEPALPLVI